MKVVMIGADRSVKGGVSAVVNNLYQAGLNERVALTYIGTMVDGGRAKKACKAFFALLRFVLAMPGTDIVHVNMAADASCFRKMIFMQVAQLFHKKIVIHEHGGDFQGFFYERCDERMRRRIKRALNRAALFLVLSDAWKDFFSELVDPAKIHVMQNAVPVPGKGKTDYSGHRAVFLGRLCKEKGIGELLLSVPLIRKRIPDFELVLGGFWENGNEDLQKRAQELSDAVICPGWVSAGERERLFETCSIFVLPTWFEGQPVSLLEAMAAGMCVAASAVGGIPQIVADKKEADVSILPEGWDGCGILMEAKNPEMLAEVMSRLLEEEALRRRLGERARARILEHYDMEQYVETLVGFYESVCSNSSGSAHFLRRP